MLTIKNLEVAYDKQLVLEKLELSIELNHIHGIVGLNGSGKTTLFNTIFGMVKQKNGTIEYNDNKLFRKDIAFLETQNYFYSNITGREYLQLFASTNSFFNLKIWEELLNLPLDEIIDNYSTGMKKKLALLCVIKLNKPILLLDEPYNGIDIDTSRILNLLLIKLKENKKTIIVSSHILETLTNTCDYIHYLDEKKIIKTYHKEQFEEIYKDIFKERDEQTNYLIDKSLNNSY